VADLVPLARVVRSDVVEAVHLGSVAVCDAGGRLVASAGDAASVTFARSSLKPLQAAVSLDVAGEHPSAEEIAVMCASHNAEQVHVDAVHRLLGGAGLGTEALRCPPAWPLDAGRAREVAGPARDLHMCSGKHAGMLLACERAALPVETYLEPTHPLQERVLAAVETGTGAAPTAIGVDGCGLPVPALPLAGLATLYARLLDPGPLAPLGPSAAAATDAMRAHPYLVAGRGRLCTPVMEAVPGAIVKIGAEGVVCAGLAEGLGVAVKVADGASRARGPVLVSVLRQLNALGPDAEAALAEVGRPPVQGGGVSVGHVEALVELSRA
jgi:L-asparaginase II